MLKNYSHVKLQEWKVLQELGDLIACETGSTKDGKGLGQNHTDFLPPGKISPPLFSLRVMVPRCLGSCSHPTAFQSNLWQRPGMDLVSMPASCSVLWGGILVIVLDLPQEDKLGYPGVKCFMGKSTHIIHSISWSNKWILILSIQTSALVAYREDQFSLSEKSFHSMWWKE